MHFKQDDVGTADAEELQQAAACRLEWVFGKFPWEIVVRDGEVLKG